MNLKLKSKIFHDPGAWIEIYLLRGFCNFWISFICFQFSKCINFCFPWLKDKWWIILLAFSTRLIMQIVLKWILIIILIYLYMVITSLIVQWIIDIFKEHFNDLSFTMTYPLMPLTFSCRKNWWIRYMM